jgi:hypothetical protein
VATSNVVQQPIGKEENGKPLKTSVSIAGSGGTLGTRSARKVKAPSADKLQSSKFNNEKYLSSTDLNINGSKLL